MTEHVTAYVIIQIHIEEICIVLTGEYRRTMYQLKTGSTAII